MPVIPAKQAVSQRIFDRHTGESRYPEAWISNAFLDPGFHRGDEFPV
jgi:hypothetical protein